MWPFKKKIKVQPQLLYSQLDLTDGFGDNLSMDINDWIKTQPLNLTTKDPESMGLPSTSATSEEVYQIGIKMSAIRESVRIENDGVYCPICHIANPDLSKLHSPCPECGRKLLKFGWD